MYVVKVGEFYIKSVTVAFGGYIEKIELSKETMGHYTLVGAERLAKLVNGEVIEITEEVTND